MVLNRGAIRKFQVIQKSLTRIVVKLVATDAFTEADAREINDKIQAVMEGACTVDIEKVAEIPALASGKYRYTISELD